MTIVFQFSVGFVNNDNKQHNDNKAKGHRNRRFEVANKTVSPNGEVDGVGHGFGTQTYRHESRVTSVLRENDRNSALSFATSE